MAIFFLFSYTLARIVCIIEENFKFYHKYMIQDFLG